MSARAGAPGPGRPGGGPGRTGTMTRPAPGRSLPPPAHTPRVRLSEAFPGLIRQLPHHKPWMVTIGAIAVVVVLATCGLGSYMLVHDDNSMAAAVPTAAPSTRVRDIDSRTTDGALMTAKDVFPDVQIIAAPGVPPYKRVGDVQVETNCRLGATNDVATMLVSMGCDQMVRATFSTPDGKHFVTAGVFNLLDDKSTKSAADQFGKLVNASNRFTGFITTTPTQVLARAPTNLAYLADGHFLLYTVIARTDGNESSPDDPQIKVIVYDMLEHYLRDGALVKWATELLTASGSAAASPSH
jgi:hypothetical protein